MSVGQALPAPRRAGAGPALPPWVVLASLAVTLVAAVAFFVTGLPDRAVQADARTAPETSVSGVSPLVPTPNSLGAGTSSHSKESDPGRPGDDPVVPTRTASVDVYNNAAVSGLAVQTGADVRTSGWTVVTEDNWYGDVPQNTVYYPAALADQAKLLAKDLGIDRVRPAVSPMSFDRLTLILTSAP